MKKLIDEIKLKADSIPTNTKENRRAKGAYVDCLMMAREASENLVLADVSGRSEQLFAFLKWYREEQPITCDHKAIIEKYLKANNCH